MKKSFIYIVLSVIASCLAFSCEKQPADDIAVSEVRISAPADTLLAGETMELTVEVLPAEASNKEYDLSVNEDGKNIVEIIDNTHIKGLKAGSAYITATAKENGKSGSVKVTVKENPDNPGPGPGPGPDDPVVPTESTFEFAIEVDGVDVDIDIMPKVDSSYYVTHVLTYYLGSDGEVQIDLKQSVLDDIAELVKSGKTFDEILRTGDSEYNFSHNDQYPLMNNESYTVYAVVIDGDESEFRLGTGNTQEFRTEARGSYEGEENILTLTSTSTDNTITVDITATTDDAYYVACMKEADYNEAFQVSTSSEIMGYFYFHYEDNYHTYDAEVKKESSSKTITFENLSPGTNYVIAAFGYINNEEYNKPTTEYYTDLIATTGTPKDDEEDNKENLHVVFRGASASLTVGYIYGQPCTDGSRYYLTLNSRDENTYVTLDLWPAVKFQIEGKYDETRGTANGIGQLGAAESRYYYMQDGVNKNLPLEGQCEIVKNSDGTFTVTGKGKFQYQLESIDFSYTGAIEGYEGSEGGNEDIEIEEVELNPTANIKITGTSAFAQDASDDVDGSCFWITIETGNPDEYITLDITPAKAGEYVGKYTSSGGNLGRQGTKYYYYDDTYDEITAEILTFAEISIIKNSDGTYNIKGNATLYDTEKDIAFSYTGAIPLKGIEEGTPGEDEGTPW